MLILRALRRNFSVDLQAIYKVSIADNTVDCRKRRNGFGPEANQSGIFCLIQIGDLQKLNDDLIRTHGSWKRYASGLKEDAPP